MACGIFPDQGSNPCSLCWEADSYPLCHREVPKALILWHSTFFMIQLSTSMHNYWKKELRDIILCIPLGGIRTPPQGCTLVFWRFLPCLCISSFPWWATAWICPLELKEGHGGWSLFPTNKNGSPGANRVLLGFSSIISPKCPIGNDFLFYVWVKICVCHCRIFHFIISKHFEILLLPPYFYKKETQAWKDCPAVRVSLELCLLVWAEDPCKSPRPFRGSSRYFLCQLHVCVKQGFLQILQPTLYMAMVQCRSRLENPVAFVSRDIIEICKI